jgi:hypothetical protein
MLKLLLHQFKTTILRNAESIAMSQAILNFRPFSQLVTTLSRTVGLAAMKMVKEMNYLRSDKKL